MSGKRTLILSLVLALLRGRGNFLVPLIQRWYPLWIRNRQFDEAVSAWNLPDIRQLVDYVIRYGKDCTTPWKCETCTERKS